jgi:hypothetical protein
MHPSRNPRLVAACWLLALPWLAAGAASAADDPCNVSAREAQPCRHRAGHCFDLSIDGQRTQLLADAALRAELSRSVGRPVCWTLAAPVAGELDTEVVPNAHTERLGVQRAPLELVITALEGQVIPTRKAVRTDPTVRIGGMPMQTVVDAIDTAALPAGAYVVQVRYVGTGNWDQQLVHLTVAER